MMVGHFLVLFILVVFVVLPLLGFLVCKFSDMWNGNDSYLKYWTTGFCIIIFLFLVYMVYSTIGHFFMYLS